MRTLSVAVAVILLLAGPARADEYPTALIERPQVLPRGLFEVDAALGHTTRRALGIEILSAEESELAVRAGVSARLELGAATALRLHPDARWDRNLSLVAVYRAVEWDPVDLAPRLELPLSFRRGYDLVDTMWLGPGLRARVGDRFFAIAGRRFLPIDIRPAIALHAGLDGGIGVQLTSSLALLAETELARVTLFGPIDRTSTFIDAWPLTLSALLATRQIDTVLELGAGDALAPGDQFSIAMRIGVRP